MIALLDIHRAVEAVLVEPLALERDLDEVHEAGELREHDSAEARVFLLEAH